MIETTAAFYNGRRPATAGGRP